LNLAFTNDFKKSLDGVLKSNNFDNKRNLLNDNYNSNNILSQSLNRNFLDYSNQNFFVNGTFDSAEWINPNEKK
jgi:hypothetical protein